MAEFVPRSAGEALLRRRLRVEKRGGVEHYVPGQVEVELFDTEDDDDDPVERFLAPEREKRRRRAEAVGLKDLPPPDGAMAGYVNVMGHAVVAVLVKIDGSPWQGMLYREVAYGGGFDSGLRMWPERLKIPDEVKVELP